MTQPSPALLTPAHVRDVLAHGELEIEARMADASNATLVGTSRLDGVGVTCVYKPQRGERPLWDFPDHTLAQREIATYLLSQAADWPVVPPTVWRDGGPAGPGMCQAWVEPSTDEGASPGAGLVDVVAPGALGEGWLHVIDAHESRGRPVALVHADNAALQHMALLDAVTNNADRKGGHVLFGRTPADGADRVYGVDHGLTFHEENKLRTVLWGWAGEPLDDESCEQLQQLDDQLSADLGRELTDLLSAREVKRTRQRLRNLVRSGCYPLPGEGWPALPWPAF